MEFVDRTQLEVPDSWLEYASNCLKILLEAEEARTAEVNRRWDAKSSGCPGWSILRENLQTLNNGRCWYCETPDPMGRWRFQIDHFRPKSRAKNRDGSVRLRTGYWWLAFDYLNFRVTCQLCNGLDASHPDGVTRGKNDYFPLCDESIEAQLDSDLSEERPLLLDPCDEVDCQLLDFDIQGRPWAALGATESDRDRVHVTIIRLNLDAVVLTEARKKVLWEAELAVQSWIRAKKTIETTMDDKIRKSEGDKCVDAVIGLRRLLAPTSAYRSVVRRHLSRRLLLEPILRQYVLSG